MFKRILTSILQIQFVRQLFGAVGGALIALAVYTAYKGTHDAVRAYLIPPGTSGTTYTGEVRVSDTSVYQDNDKLRRITARARANAEQLNANQQESVQMEPMRDAAPAVAEKPVERAVESFVSVPSVSASLTKKAELSAPPSSPTETEAMHQGAPNLPNSGIGLWIAVLGSLGVSFVCTRKLRMFLLSAQCRVD